MCSDFLYQQLALWLWAAKLLRAVRHFLAAVTELLSRMVSPGAWCVWLCLATQETGITSGPLCVVSRQWEVNSSNDWLASGHGLGIKLAFCSDRERNVRLEPPIVCETLNRFHRFFLAVWIEIFKENMVLSGLLTCLIFQSMTLKNQLGGLKAILSRWTVSHGHFYSQLSTQVSLITNETIVDKPPRQIQGYSVL